MSGAFQLVGGTATPIKFKITGTTAVQVAGNAIYPIRVFWLNCVEITGATPNLTVDIYDGTTAFFIRPVSAMTAKGSYYFEAGIWLNPGDFLRVTAGAANQIDVTGLASLPVVQT